MEKREWTLKELEDALKELDFPKYPQYLGDGLWELFPGCYTGQRGIELFNGNLDTHSLDITLNPVNNSDKQTTYTFKNEYSSTTISPAFGNYYIIHPKAITGIEGGLFSYTVDRFQAIDIE